MFSFKLDQLRVALSAGAPARPVAQIQLTDCELMSGLYNDVGHYTFLK
jgi:hypothetical protein